MPAPSHNIHVDPYLTYTDAPGKVGEVVEYLHDTYGRQRFRLVYNNTASSLVAYSAVDYDSGSSLNVDVAAVDAPKSSVAGIPQVAIGAAKYGYALCAGEGLGIAAAAVAINTPLGVSILAGRLDDTGMATVALSRAEIAWAIAAAAAAGDSFRVRVSCE